PATACAWPTCCGDTNTNARSTAAPPRPRAAISAASRAASAAPVRVEVPHAADASISLDDSPAGSREDWQHHRQSAPEKPTPNTSATTTTTVSAIASVDSGTRAGTPALLLGANMSSGESGS